MNLSDWLDEYRALAPDTVERGAASDDDDWQEPDLLAPTDRVRDRSPRWLDRASRIGYARATQI